jgi:flavin-binding protein dodecin
LRPTSESRASGGGAAGIGYNDFAGGLPSILRREDDTMAKKGGAAVYRVTEVIGTSSTSWEDAAKNAVKTAAGSLRDLRIAEIEKLDVKIENGRITQYRARLALSFKYGG